MNTKTIREIKAMYDNQQLTDEIIEKLRQDPRKGVQTIVKAYNRNKLKQNELITRFKKMKNFDQTYNNENIALLAGVDEAGRGPLAGPVVAAAVILPNNFKLVGLTDSKQLTVNKRKKYATKIKEEALSYYIAMVTNEEIDRINIYEATKKAMTTALLNLDQHPDQALIDAVQLNSLPFITHSVVKGDELSLSIAAASILAKVKRDEIMEELHEKYPIYQFNSNMGYGTKEHIKMIKKHGISPYHRKSFAPVKNLLEGAL